LHHPKPGQSQGQEHGINPCRQLPGDHIISADSPLIQPCGHTFCPVQAIGKGQVSISGSFNQHGEVGCLRRTGFKKLPQGCRMEG